MLAWEGPGTRLPLGFTALRIEANDLWCTTKQTLPHDAGPEAEARACTTDSVQLLCRALRLAPACYRRFELAVQQPHEPISIGKETRLMNGDDGPDHKPTKFQSIAAVAAAMRQFEAAEGVSVCLMPDERSVVIVRNDQCNA